MRWVSINYILVHILLRKGVLVKAVGSSPLRSTHKKHFSNGVFFFTFCSFEESYGRSWVQVPYEVPTKTLQKWSVFLFRIVFIFVCSVAKLDNIFRTQNKLSLVMGDILNF